MGQATEKKANSLTRALDLLAAQSTGVVCALTSAALLGIGSIIADRFPDAYEGLAMDDLRFFFEPVRAIHVWLYVLMVVLAIWGASSLLCAWNSVRARLRARVFRPSAYGTPLLHFTFALALVAHLWGGLTATSQRHVVASQSVEVAGVRLRALRLEHELHPNGALRQMRAWLELDDGSTQEQRAAGFNEPLMLQGGARELLFGGARNMPSGAVLRHRGQRLELMPGQSTEVEGERVTLLQIHSGPTLRRPVVSLAVGTERQMLPLDPHAEGTTAFVQELSRPVVFLIERHNPSVPLVILVALLTLVGVVLMLWERWRR